MTDTGSPSSNRKKEWDAFRERNIDTGLETDNGVMYGEGGLSPSGQAFILFPDQEHTKEDINLAKADLRRKFDVTTIKVASEDDWDYLYKGAYFKDQRLRPLRWYQIEQSPYIIRRERLKQTPPWEFVEKFVLPYVEKVERENAQTSKGRIYNDEMVTLRSRNYSEWNYEDKGKYAELESKVKAVNPKWDGNLNKLEDGGELAKGGKVKEKNTGKIDGLINDMKEEYLDKVDEILDLPLYSDVFTHRFQKRDELEAWVLDPKNKVKVVIAFSGGKDSVAMVLKALDMGIPKDQIELWHHDVDGGSKDLFDWKCTRSYCDEFAKAFDLKILYSYRKGGIAREIYKENEVTQSIYFQKEMGGEFFIWTPKDDPDNYDTRLKFPSVGANMQTRWCSYQAKIDVMQKAITHSERFQNSNILIMTGERREESTNRGKYAEIEKYRGATLSRRAITWRAIIDWSENEVWDIMHKYMVQPHPCYELGWGRCSCQLCIFGNANTWASLNEISPDKVKQIAGIEQDLKEKSEAIVEAEKKDPSLIKIREIKGELVPVPFVSIPSLYHEFEQIPTGKIKNGKPTFTKGKKLDNVYQARVDRGKSFVPQEKIDRWKDEALGTFTSPIIVDKWELPAGAFSTENGTAAN